MTVRIYRSTDAGAPTRTGLTGTHVNMLRQILRACLVDGYGAKPAAGWSVVDEGSQGFSITNANGSGIINFFQADTRPYYYGITIYLLESMTGSVNGRLSGDNIRSGPWFTGSTDVNRHTILPMASALGSNLASSYWSIIADENTCMLILAGPLSSGSARWGDMFLYMGEIKSPLSGPARFVVSGGCNSYGENATTNGASSIYAPFGFGNTALRDLVSGAIPSAASNFGCAELNTVSGTGYTNMLATSQYSGELTMARARVYTGAAAGKGQVGFFRGIIMDPSLAVFDHQTAMTALGLARSEASMGVFVGAPGESVAIFSSRNSPTFFVTDNPAYW